MDVAVQQKVDMAVQQQTVSRDTVPPGRGH
jgi:hypothetical protein